MTTTASSVAIGRRPRRRRRSTVSNTIGIVLVVIWLFPTYWMINTSFKTTANITTPTPQFVPLPPTLDNYARAVEKAGFLSSLVNSLLTGLSVTAIAIVFGFLAAAAVTRFAFRGRKPVLIAILVIQMIPATAMLIPIFLAFKQVGLLNSYPGLIAAYVASALPFSIWVLRGFFQGVPVEIEEAARVDGARTWRVLWNIYFPLVAPGVISTSVFAFIAAWNDYVMAYVLLRDQAKYTLPVWLVSFSTDTETDYGGLIAASVLFALPVVIFFMIVQRNLVSGMSAGAVKG